MHDEEPRELSAEETSMAMITHGQQAVYILSCRQQVACHLLHAADEESLMVYHFAC